MAPMTCEFAPGRHTAERDVVDYYRRRSEGGEGLTVTEGMAINAAGAYDGRIPLFFDPET